MQVHDVPPIPLLSYAKRPAWHQRKRFRRISSFLLFLALLIGVGFLWRSRLVLWTDARFWYFQHECVSYTAPEDQIVGMFDTPDAMSALTKKNRLYVMESHASGTIVRRLSPDWDRYCAMARSIPVPPPVPSAIIGSTPTTFPADGGGAYLLPTDDAPWGPGISFVGGETLAFMHERQTANGHRRLVIVELSFANDMSIWYLASNVSAIHPRPSPDTGTWASGLAIRATYPQPSPEMARSKVKSCRFFAGQIDPADPSRFTIRYAIDGIYGTIDGQLLDNEQIKMTVRDGAARVAGQSVPFEQSPAAMGL